MELLFLIACCLPTERSPDWGGGGQGTGLGLEWALGRHGDPPTPPHKLLPLFRVRTPRPAPPQMFWRSQSSWRSMCCLTRDKSSPAGCWWGFFRFFYSSAGIRRGTYPFLQQVLRLEAEGILTPEHFCRSCLRTFARRVSFKTSPQMVTNHHEQTVVAERFGRGQI